MKHTAQRSQPSGTSPPARSGDRVQRIILVMMMLTLLTSLILVIHLTNKILSTRENTEDEYELIQSHILDRGFENTKIILAIEQLVNLDPGGDSLEALKSRVNMICRPIIVNRSLGWQEGDNHLLEKLYGKDPLGVVSRAEKSDRPYRDTLGGVLRSRKLFMTAETRTEAVARLADLKMAAGRLIPHIKKSNNLWAQVNATYFSVLRESVLETVNDLKIYLGLLVFLVFSNIMLTVLFLRLRKRWMAALMESEETARALLNSLSDPALLMAPDGKILALNQETARRLSGEIGQFVGANGFDLVPPDTAKIWKKYFDQAVKTRETVRFDGSVGKYYLENIIVPIKDSQGTPTMMAAYGRDVTRLKRSEEKISKALQEKDVLLKEIHHRVKNNMQVIISLLNLQTHRTKGEDAREAMLESQNRIRAMALVHENLYKSDNLADIDFGQYAARLASDIFQAYNADPSQIALDIQAEDTPLPIDCAVPCGLVLNELLSNALKHAFPGGRSGRVTVSIRNIGHLFELKVSDDGVGFPEGVDFRQSGTLGLDMVTGLIEGQLEGHVTLERGSGITTITVTFDNGALEPRGAPKE